jgi:hypothetical protein
VAAEPALGISVGGEGFSAGGAGEVVQALGRLFDQELVGAPPFLAAGGSTEDPLLALGNLDDLLAALLACTFGGISCSRQESLLCSAKAQGFDGPLLKGEAGGNMAVGAAEAAHLKDLGFLVFCHFVLLDEGSLICSSMLSVCGWGFDRWKIKYSCNRNMNISNEYLQ